MEDPYFGGEGPERTGCVRCAACMIGCRYGAKNTLVKNYLWFAERLGVEILPERQVSEIRPLGAADGSEGYEVTTEHPGAWLRKRRRTLTARGVVVAAGALGTNQLLANCKHGGALPRISDRLGSLVRTNSESIQAVTASPRDGRDFTESVAISSSIYPDPDTHIEVVSYGRGGDAMSRLFTIMTGEGTRLTRPIKWIGAMLRHPLKAARLLLLPVGWSRRTIILLVMQSLDTAMRLRPKRRLFGRGVRLQTEQDPERPNPTFIPAAERAARWFAEQVDGVAQSGLTESALNIPTTAHILGGAVIAGTPEDGVVDRTQPRLRLREPDRDRRLGGAGEPRGQPVADDHGDRRASDELRPGRAGIGPGGPPGGRAPRRERRRRRGLRPVGEDAGASGDDGGRAAAGEAEAAARALAIVVRVGEQRIPFGEAGPAQARAHAEYLGELTGFGPTQRVRPIAHGWRELAEELERRQAAAVSELDPGTVVAYAERLWILPPPQSMLA